MSRMIQCNSCKKLFDDDSSSKGKIHGMWIDQDTGFHLCDECLLKMLKEYAPDVYDYEMSLRED